MPEPINGQIADHRADGSIQRARTGDANEDLEELGHPSQPQRTQAKEGDSGDGSDRTSKDDRKRDEAQAADDSDSDGNDKAAEKSPPWSTTKKVIVFGSLGAVVLVAAFVATLWYLHSRHFEKTDDAFIDAHVEMVAPQIAGRVIEVAVDDNTVVEPGRPLLKIDPRDYQAALDQAEGSLAEAKGKLAEANAQRDVASANVEQANADVEQARANLDNANAQLRRYEGLSREAQSPQRLDDLKTTARSAAAQLVAQQKRAVSQAAQITLAESEIVAADATIRSAQARVTQAQLNLSYTTVVATTGGRVTNRNVQVGDYVQPGQQLLILVPKQVWVTANFKETQLNDMRAGQPVSIHVDAFPDVEFGGHVDSMQAGASAVFSLLPPQNATGNYVKVVQRVPVKIVFDDMQDDAYRRLGPGMSVAPSVRVR